MSDAGGETSSFRRTLLPLLLVGFLLRLSPLAVPQADTLLHLRGGPDAYYHLRRAELAAQGRLERFDAWVNYPAGLRVHWPPLYDLALGAVHRCGGAAALSAVPVVVGTTFLLVLCPWAARLLGANAGLAVLLLAVLPAAVRPTLWGAIDHHGLEALLFAAALSAAAAGGRRGLAGAAAVAAASAFLIPSWPVPATAVLLAIVLRGASAARAGTALVVGAAFLPLAGRSYWVDPWVRIVTEAQPLLGGVESASGGLLFLSAGLPLLPFAMIRWWRRRDDPAAAAALAAAATALPLALIQIRFRNVLVVPAAFALVEFFGASRGAGRRLAGLLLAASCFMGAGTSVVEARRPSPLLPHLEGAIRMLRDLTPPAGDPFDPLSRPAYGVVAEAEVSPYLLALARRPVLTSPFHGPSEGMDAAHRILFLPPAEATAWADSAGARYLLLTRIPPAYIEAYRIDTDLPVETSLYARLYFFGDADAGWIRIYASPPDVAGGPHPPACQVWERRRPTPP